MQAAEALTMVRHAIARGRTAHGYLIVGPLRADALVLAQGILQTLFCRAQPPCMKCAECENVATRNHSDIHWLYPEKKSRIISADQMLGSLINVITQTSFAGGWKAGVLVGADRLNEASANIFLKTLEEPPPRTLFLLLTESPQQLLPTIVSRCQRLDLSVPHEIAEPWQGRVLEVLGSDCFATPMQRMAGSHSLCRILADIKDSARELVLADAQEQEGASDGDLYEEGKDIFEARVTARYKELRIDVVLTLMRWFRDLLLLKGTGESAQLYYEAYGATLRARSSNLTLAQALRNIALLEEFGGKLDLNVPEDTLLATLLDRLHHGVV